MERSKVACPNAAMPSEKYEYPRPSSHWLQGTIAAAAKSPMATRPVGPIQLLSKAYFRKRQTATMSARMPSRLNQLPPIRDSRSCELVVEAWAIGAKVGELGAIRAVGADAEAVDRTGGAGGTGCGVTFGAPMGAGCGSVAGAACGTEGFTASAEAISGEAVLV